MILETFPAGPFETNAYLVGCANTRQAVVIDAPPGVRAKILHRIEELSLTVTGIFITHSHWDHIGDAAALKEALHTPLSIHPEDVANLTSPGSDGLPMILPIPATGAEHLLADGEKISVGNLEIQVIHTPGHTPGGVCFYLPQEKVLFSGDTLFHKGIGNLSFPTARPAAMWDSLRKLAALPADTTVYPGHGGPTLIADEQWILNAEDCYDF